MENLAEIRRIRAWLGTGSLNLFGLPMSGKDTVGVRLAETLGAKFLSSGEMIRRVEAENAENLTASGALIPTDRFYDIVLPYFGREELRGYPLVLSSVGRWSGEEVEVMAAAARQGHPVRAAIYLEISEAEAEARRQTAVASGDRGVRADDASAEVFATRLREFREKTRPVLESYRREGILVRVEGVGTREEVFGRVVEELRKLAEG